MFKLIKLLVILAALWIFFAMNIVGGGGPILLLIAVFAAYKIFFSTKAS